MPSERVERWLSEAVATCPWCERDVTRTDARGLDHEDRISHLRCLDEGAEGPCPICRQPITRRQKREKSDRGLIHKSCLEDAKRR